MRKRLGYLLAWLLATVVAATGSWVGLQPLLGAASPELPARLSASQLRAAAPSPSPGPAVPTPGSGLGSSPSPTPSLPTPSPTEPSPSPGSPQSHPALPLLPATSQWQELPGRRGYERTFVVRGGEAVFEVSRREVRVTEHTANSDYEVSVNRWSRSSLILSFESVERTSRIWVMWRSGPYAEVTETV